MWKWPGRSPLLRAREVNFGHPASMGVSVYILTCYNAR